MPRKNFYISDADLYYYERAKELAGESLSSVLVQFLKNYVKDKEIQENEMESISLFIGEEDYCIDNIKGERIKFIGKQISVDVYDLEPERIITYKLFYTRKSKFLVYLADNDISSTTINHHYVIYDKFNDLYNANLTKKLISDAEKFFGNVSDVVCKELDI